MLLSHAVVFGSAPRGLDHVTIHKKAERKKERETRRDPKALKREKTGKGKER